MLKRAYPISWEDKEYLSLADWRKHAKPFFFSSRKSVKLTHTDSRVLSERVNRMKRGEYCFFSAVWYNLGTDYDWLTNPDTNYKYNANVHWTTVEDIVPESGDIKYGKSPVFLFSMTLSSMIKSLVKIMRLLYFLK